MPDPTPPPADDLLARVRAGSQTAATELFDRYAGRLMQLARSRIGQRMTSRFDPEDVIQSVFRTFFTRLKEDKFTLDDMDDLSRLLVGITVRKTLRQLEHHGAARRNPAAEVGQEAEEASSLSLVTDDEPTPEAVVVFCDELEHLLKKFPADERAVLELRVQGFSSEEIAQKLGTYDRKVRRVLERVRSVVEQEMGGLG
ncbi:MAG: RNA polymerase sigma factor [Fimbriiglobus sp.]